MYKSAMVHERQCYMPRWHVFILGALPLQHWDIGHIILPYWRLYWTDRPGAWIAHYDTRWDVGPDRLVMVAPYTKIAAGADHAPNLLAVHFTASQPYDFVRDWVGMEILPPVIQEEASALGKDARAADAKRRSTRFGTCLSGLITRGMSVVPDNLLAEGHLEPRVDKVMRLIGENLLMSVEEMAGSVHLSTRSLHRLFVQSLGHSPKQVQFWLRLKQSESKLMYSDDSIETIAADCGFTDRSHFSRVFSRVHGMGPAEYRKHAEHL